MFCRCRVFQWIYNIILIMFIININVIIITCLYWHNKLLSYRRITDYLISCFIYIVLNDLRRITRRRVGHVHYVQVICEMSRSYYIIIYQMLY